MCPVCASVCPRHVDLHVGLAAQLLVASDTAVELGEETALCEKVGLSMLLERGVAPPLQADKEILWLRRAVSVAARTSAVFNLRVLDPVLRNFVQLMLVETATGTALEAAGDSIGPVTLEPGSSYVMLARSLIGALPDGYDVAAEDFACPWLLRCTHSAEAVPTLAPLPAASVFDDQGYFVDNPGAELFRYQLTPPEPPAAEDGAEEPAAAAPSPVLVTCQVRTLSPAVVSMALLDVKTEEVWNQGVFTKDEEQRGIWREEGETIDPTNAVCTTSMERDSKITSTPVRASQGFNGCAIAEFPLVFQQGRQYILLARLESRLPAVVFKAVGGGGEGEGEGEGEGAGADAEGGADGNAADDGDQGGQEEDVKRATPPPEMVAVTNEIEEPGAWALARNVGVLVL